MPIPQFDDDLAYVFADIGEPVEYLTQRTNGYLNQQSADTADAGGFRVRSGDIQLVIQDGSLTLLAQNGHITHNGISYTIRDIGTRLTDGRRVLSVTRD